jgi:plasmid maintenance system killer protein
MTSSINFSSEELLELYKRVFDISVREKNSLMSTIASKIEAAVLQKLEAADASNDERAFYAWEKSESDKITGLSEALLSLSKTEKSKQKRKPSKVSRAK